jgi:hypothetical protein
MPIPGEAVRIDLVCGGPDGSTIIISVTAEALLRLGLHPSQSSSKIVGPTPAWWYRRIW